MKKLTREWVQKAEEDFVAAQRANQKPRLLNACCFHCQQTVEKYFKALMQEVGMPILKIHGLVELLDLILVEAPELKRFRRGRRLNDLSQFAVDARYPGKKATGVDARSGLKLADKIRQEIRTRLGLRDKRRKR
jgi:HEPN domain-containing protein